MKRPSLKSAIDSGKFITAPGIFDMISAIISKKVGFDFVYSSGYWSVASSYGIPDAGIATYTEMLARVEMLARTVEAGIIADADTGYGGLLNVHTTVRGFEAAGVSAIQIEDQSFPKKCGHTPNKQVVSCEEMAEKIQVACDARRFPEETLIIARTDARGPEGFSKACDRAKAYREAGADIIFVEALNTEDEMRTSCREIEAPMMANMADGGKTPILPAAQLEDLGYAMAIFPAMTALAASAAIEKSLINLKEDGTSLSKDIPLFNFDEFNHLIGFPEIWELEEKWALQRLSSKTAT